MAGANYPGATTLDVNQFALRGRWRVNDQRPPRVSGTGAIQARFQAANVYLVLTSAGTCPGR